VPFRAPEVLFDQGAAVAVGDAQRRSRGVAEIPVAPPHQGHQSRIEVETHLGQPVFVALPLAGLAVGDLAQQSFLHQSGQPGAEHLPGRSRGGLHVGEAPNAAERLTQHQERPLLADDAQGAFDGAVVHPQGQVAGSRRIHVRIVSRHRTTSNVHLSLVDILRCAAGI